ncbi:helix-turn-helix domain-containing protein [Leucobacter viscericola]|uniref:Helix-turn-helix domain-containing protein n=1 Tax=Leucobacter viscericola TaxID=2714935 RepID=A0A6G7XIB0_9MICO|nr:helix-turn-helix domain-containing protein [Leucobacter viscericola]QIK64108.1 helix-turn-helix domain-containing protein [Leucobacter viscericola]
MSAVIDLAGEREARVAEPGGFEDVPAIMSPGQLAEVLDVSVRTLERWRVDGEGPAFQHPKLPNRFYRYFRRDVIAWLENKEPGAGTPGETDN